MRLQGTADRHLSAAWGALPPGKLDLGLAGSHPNAAPGCHFHFATLGKQLRACKRRFFRVIFGEPRREVQFPASAMEVNQ